MCVCVLTAYACKRQSIQHMTSKKIINFKKNDFKKVTSKNTFQIHFKNKTENRIIEKEHIQNFEQEKMKNEKINIYGYCCLLLFLSAGGFFGYFFFNMHNL